MRLALALLITFLAASAAAHPPVSVVIDSKGNVYYSDLHQVWRIAPNGQRTIAVPNVHTHELVLDAKDTLYGEHLWYEGERVDKWGHYVWRRLADGRIEKVIPSREGFLDNYSFVRDRAGTMYWGDRKKGLIRKRFADGRIVTHARLPKGNLRWMSATPNGTLHFISSGDLYRVPPNGAVSLLADGLGSRTLLSLGKVDQHSVMGIWTDRAGRVYVADSANRCVRRVEAGGKTSVVFTTAFPWSVSGGAFDAAGSLWVLEYSTTNQARVRRVAVR